MARTDFTTPRLYLDLRPPRGRDARRFRPIRPIISSTCCGSAAGARVLTFNGRDGEFAASIGAVARKSATLAIGERTRPQEYPPDVDYLFAPLKHARLDYVAQKAVEMGARRLTPGHHPRAPRPRASTSSASRANAREAAEQCGVIWLPEIDAPERLEKVLAGWPAERLLVFCDEDAPQANPIAALARRRAERPAFRC